jgi:hypothetical protein
MSEWIQANAIWMVVGVTALLLAYYIIKLIESIKKRRRTISSLEFILQIWALLFLIFIVSMGSELQPSDWLQVILLGGLVTVTAIYATASVKTANAMIEQNKTLRETVSISVRPSVSIEITRIGAGKHYPFEPPGAFVFLLQNKGKGAARNVVVTCEGQDQKVEYSKVELPSLNVGDVREFDIHRRTDVLAKEIRVAYVIFEVTYNDDLGEIWLLKLEIDKDGESWKAGETTCERLF